jgi:hypothetical protein
MSPEAISFVQNWIARNVNRETCGEAIEMLDLNQLAQNCRSAAQIEGHALTGEEFFMGERIETLILQIIRSWT